MTKQIETPAGMIGDLQRLRAGEIFIRNAPPIEIYHVSNLDSLPNASDCPVCRVALHPGTEAPSPNQ